MTPAVFLPLERLQPWLCGSLQIEMPGGGRRIQGSAPGPEAMLRLRDPAFAFAALRARGLSGFADAYAEGAWDSPDLQALCRWLFANQDRLQMPMSGSGPAAWLSRIGRWLQGLTGGRARAAAQVAAHYDLPPAFFAPWLDAEMNYSSALFESPGQSLEAAQAAKQARLLDSADVQPGDRCLEIGCGWGSLSRRMAAMGAEVTAVTNSRAQAAYAAAGGQGLARLSVRLADWRDLGGLSHGGGRPFRRILSVEMVEAIGRRNWRAFARRLAAALEPEAGVAVLQMITLRPDLDAAYRRGDDFIRRRIFPGGALIGPERFRLDLSQAGLQVRQTLQFGQSYAITLQHWGERFAVSTPALRNFGFDERFTRRWSLYLASCAAAFDLGRIDVVHWRLTRDIPATG